MGNTIHSNTIQIYGLNYKKFISTSWIHFEFEFRTIEQLASERLNATSLLLSCHECSGRSLSLHIDAKRIKRCGSYKIYHLWMRKLNRLPQNNHKSLSLLSQSAQSVKSSRHVLLQYHGRHRASPRATKSYWQVILAIHTKSYLLPSHQVIQVKSYQVILAVRQTVRSRVIKIY